MNSPYQNGLSLFWLGALSPQLKGEMLALVGIAPQLGPYVEYSTASDSRLDFLKQHIPVGIDFRQLSAIFKYDIHVDCVVECLYDCCLYYATTSEGRGDELYYFRTKDRLFHGEKIWSSYHPFVSQLKALEPSSRVLGPCWFVGSRNNYTHQLVDFIPSLLHRANLGSYAPNAHAIVFGSHNPILDSLLEVPAINQGLLQPKIFLSTLGSPSIVGSWKVRCVHFNTLYLVRHMSIFRAFDLLRTAFCSMRNPANGNHYARPKQQTRGILYLSRSDKRVANQAEIEAHLSSRWDVELFKDLCDASFADKCSKISKYKSIILPPGSDNINAFCFADDHATFCQLTAAPCSAMLQSPFTSFAGLRYNLPFLDRTAFLESKSQSSTNGIHSGVWPVEGFDQVLQDLSI